MKTLTYLGLLLVFFGLYTPTFTQSKVPFSLEMEEITYKDWPGLHSFAFGEWSGYWIMMAGRSNGLHGFFPFTGFPNASANDKIWIMRPDNGKIWEQKLTTFNSDLADALRVSNPQFVQHGQYLYIVGGYGQRSSDQNFITFPNLVAVDLDALVTAIVEGKGDVRNAFRLLKDERLRVCGAEMHELGDWIYLVGGHNFSGLYSKERTEVVQTYTSEIRRFRILDNGTNLSIVDYSAQAHAEYHRRDGNLGPIITPEGNKALAYYGGVFKPDADLPYLNPIYIQADKTRIDSSYEQVMCQYTCPILPIFDSQQRSMYSVFFGGISKHFYNSNQKKLVEDSNMPFVKDISVFIRQANGRSEEQILPLQFDELLGSNAKWIINAQAPQYENGVIKLDALSGRTLAGYIFGGIKAVIPNITPSSASNRLFRVYLRPQLSTHTIALEPVQFRIYPNPSSNTVHLSLPAEFIPDQATVYDFQGKVLQRWSSLESIQAIEQFLAKLPRGVYGLSLYNDHRGGLSKVIKI